MCMAHIMMFVATATMIRTNGTYDNSIDFCTSKETRDDIVAKVLVTIFKENESYGSTDSRLRPTAGILRNFTLHFR